MIAKRSRQCFGIMCLTRRLFSAGMKIANAQWSAPAGHQRFDFFNNGQASLMVHDWRFRTLGNSLS